MDIDFFDNGGAAAGRIRFSEGPGNLDVIPNVAYPEYGLRTEWGTATGAAVKATSATSGSLKQVARVFHYELIGGTSANGGNAKTTNTKMFTIDHGLGTEHTVVSVAHSKLNGVGDRTFVECSIHTGEYWSDTGGGQFLNSIPNDHVVIEFATAPANGVKYDVTVIG